MTTNAANKVRFSVRMHTDIMDALEELKQRRSDEFKEVTLKDLFTEGVILLLEKEGIPIKPPVPSRKLPGTSARPRRKNTAAA